MEDLVMQSVNLTLGVTSDPVAHSCGSSNDIFILQSGDDRLVAKVFNAETEEGAQFEIDILSQLTRAVDTIKTVEILVDTPLEVDGKPMLLYRSFPGRAVAAADIDAAFLSTFARAHCYIHESLDDVSTCPRERFLPDTLSFVGEFNCQSDRLVNDALPLLERLQKEIDFSAMPKTIIHDDISMENILVRDNDVCLIDFSDAHFSYRISDIANTLKELVIDNFGLVDTLLDAYVDSYSQSAQTPLANDERNALPYLFLRRALFMYCYYHSREAGATVHKDKIATQTKTIQLLMEEYSS